ncbi:hypothetical protein J4E93_005322 [Alternaria ventricosa]|uniref:uncharacterized protein n=1 Tax=Alternaria ventricosa TaxID=1187951 RepID=UPI0020C52348|nr:uncharacterized protein J4E93_005322 [Alternaria ventricosa]KAI4645744.1 hypothetical protein J4E93_005322 [Alternaria ventricosa]
MTSNAGPGAAAPTPVISSTQTLSVPATLQADGAVGNFTVPVIAEGATITNVLVLVPTGQGIRFGKEYGLSLPPGEIRSDGFFTVSYMINPAQIVFHSASPTATPTPTNAVPSSAALGGGLPQPLEDKAISGDVSKISNAIKNHVQSYYHTSRVNPGLIDYEDLHALGSGLPVSVGTLTTLIGNAATREIALRFIIAWVIISKLQPSKDPTKSLLPSEIAQCYQAVASGDRGYQAQTSLMACWRVMTAELMQASYIRNPFGPSDSRHASIQATLVTLDNVLQPYADSRMNNGERKRNLEEVLKRAALFAFTLFSQPSAWEFEWQEEQGVTSGDLCIFPALVQVADEAGNPVSPPRPFSEAVVRQLDA